MKCGRELEKGQILAIRNLSKIHYDVPIKLALLIKLMYSFGAYRDSSN